MRLEHRLQILLDDDRHRRITSIARERGVSVATVIREAIDRGVVDASAARRSSAAARVLNAPDMPVPEVTQLRRELDELQEHHGA